jgi:predicted RNA-binding protein YlqC (UPF0109 family)
VKDFVKEYAQLIVDEPNLLEVTQEVEDEFTKLSIYVSSRDVGKMIGKDGNMVNAIKTFIYGCKAKTGTSYKVQIFDINEKN